MNIWVDKDTNFIVKYGNAQDDNSSTQLNFIEGIDFNFEKGKDYKFNNGVIVELLGRPTKRSIYTATGWTESTVVLPVKEKRVNEYPPIAEQLDMLYHAMDKGEIPKATEWYNTIKAVKDNNPKE